MTYIKCPYCNYEYHPSQIFVPKYVFGKCLDITHDDTGKIIRTVGDTSCFKEQYNCDNCHNTFSVSLHMVFKSSKECEEDFREDYTLIKL